MADTTFSDASTTTGVTLQIGGRDVGPGCPTFVVAEAGVNHNGDVSLAAALIDAAADAGADAVKLQAFDAGALCSRRHKPAERDMLARYALGESALAELQNKFHPVASV